MPSTTASEGAEPVFLDAGPFVAALLKRHPLHDENRRLVAAARAGQVRACTSAGVLTEVYAALTWEGTVPRRTPEEAGRAVRLLVQEPSGIRVLDGGLEVAVRTLELAAAHGLTSRRSHDARHAATALVAGIRAVCTLDIADWSQFETDGLRIAGPPSSLRQLGRAPGAPG